MSSPPRTNGDDRETVLSRYTHMVYAIALTHTRHPADAEDAMQETFLVYLRKAPTFREEEHRKAWLIRTALNCARRVAGSAWRRRVLPTDELPDAAVTMDTPVDTALYAAMCALSAEDRTLLHLHYLEDMPTAEMARVLRRRPGTVRMQLTRARERLREIMKGEDYHD